MDATVLAVYVEPLLLDRSVLFVGDADSASLTRIVGAASEILALDTSGSGKKNKLPVGRIVPFEDGMLAEIDRTFDVVVVPDITVLGQIDFALDDAARLLTRRGRLVVGLDAERAGLDHEELWDQLAMRFDHVRFSGVASVTAAAVAELGGASRDVVVDGSLVQNPPPLTRFVAIASQTDFDVDGYLLVQLDQDPAAATAVERASRLEVKLEAAVGRAEEHKKKADVARAEREQERELRRRVEREAREGREALERRLRETEQALRSVPSAEEFGAMEERLEAQAERTRELELEVERRGRLVRELVEEARGTGAGYASVDPMALDHALDRAARAEAERAEALFLVDELRARLEDLSESSTQSLRDREAAFAGRAAGLAMRLSELEEQLLQQATEAPAEDSGLKAERNLARAENLSLVAQVASIETLERELRERCLQRLVVIVGDPTIASIDEAFELADATLEALRGEVTGLRMRIEAQDRAATVVVSRRPSDLPPPPELEALRLENEALTADLRETKAQLRVASAASTATRDALVERLQVELAESERRARGADDREARSEAEATRLREALVEASVDVESYEALARKVTGLERDLRDAIAAAEAAATDARDARSVAEASRRAADEERRANDAAQRSQEASAKALDEARTILRGLEAETRDGATPRRERGVSDDVFEAEAVSGSDGDVLVRSLTAQLEERDDRLRALERQLSGERQGDEPGALRSEVLLLEERLARLTDDLATEREARRSLERRSLAPVSAAVGTSLREAKDDLDEKQRRLEEAELRVDGFERDVRALRDAVGEARRAVEAVLSAASTEDQHLAGKLGEVLTLLGRY